MRSNHPPTNTEALMNKTMFGFITAIYAGIMLTNAGTMFVIDNYFAGWVFVITGIIFAVLAVCVWAGVFSELDND